MNTPAPFVLAPITRADVKTAWISIIAELDATPDAGETRSSLLMQRDAIKRAALALGYDASTIYQWAPV